MSVTARKITVVVGGSSGELIEAVGKAQDALKSMADVLVKVSQASVKANETTIDSNSDVAKSYDDMVASVKSAGVEVVQSLRTQMDAQQKTGESAGVAADEVATAADRQVEAMAAIARAALDTADVAGESSDRIAESAGAAADAVKASADAIKDAGGVSEDAYYGTADAAEAAADRQVEASSAVAGAAESSSAAQSAASDKNVVSAAKTADANEKGFAASSGALVKLGKATVLAGVGVAAGSLYMSAKFEKMTRQFETQAGVGVKATHQLETGILRMAGNVAQTPDELAGGMYHIASSMNNMIPAAHRSATELGILKDAADLANVGGSNLTDTTYVLSAAMNALGQYGLGGAIKTTKELNAIVGTGDMHMEDLMGAMSSGITAAAQTFGVSLHSMGAALDFMADRGVPAQQAATRLRMMISEMGAPTAQATKELQAAGMSSTEAIAHTKGMSELLETSGVHLTKLAADMRQPDGILVAIRDLKEHMDALGVTAQGQAAVVARAFGGARMGTAAEMIFEHPEVLESKYKQQSRIIGEWGSDIKKTEDTLSFSFHQTEASMESFGVTLGHDLTPVTEEFLGDLKETADWLGHNKAAAEALAGVVAGGLSVAVAAFTANKLAKMVEGLKQVGMASKYLQGGFSSSSAASGATGGVGGAGGVVSKVEGGGMIGGVLTPGMLPGSEQNPIATVQMAGERFGLGGQAAAVGEKTEASTAAASAEDAAASDIPAVEEAAVGGGMMASMKGFVGPLLDGLIKGGMIAGVGVVGSQIAGSAIGGKTGKDVSSIGTDAAIGAGIGTVVEPGIGTAIGLGLGGIVGAIKALQPESGAERRTSQVAASASFKGAAEDVQKVHEEWEKAMSKYGFLPKELKPVTKAGRGVGGEGEDKPRELTPDEKVKAKQIDEKYEAKEGKALGESFAKTNIGSPLVQISMKRLIDESRTVLAKFGPMGQEAALDFIKKTTEELEKEGRVPEGSVGKMLGGIKGILKQFGPAGYTAGVETTQGIETGLKFTGILGNLEGFSKEMDSHWEKSFGLLPITSHMTITEVTANAKADLAQLAGEMTVGTGKGREAAAAEYTRLKGEMWALTKEASSGVSTELAELAKHGGHISEEGAHKILEAYNSLPAGLKDQMTRGKSEVEKGLKDINKLTNEELKVFGVKGNAFGPSVAGAGGGKSALIPELKATGGYVQLGNAGERGQDSIPFMAGGMPVVGAPGETVAVFTHQQQAVANAALAGVGGLPGLFSSVSTPHYMAQGGMVGSAARMVAEANKITSEHYPYVWGGGHNAAFAGPYDCSGAVSAVLHAGGVLGAPEVSGQLMNIGAPGPGAVTVYANPVHAFMVLGGRAFGTHGADGAGWYTGGGLPGFAARHIPVGNESATASIAAPKVKMGGTIGAIVQGALNMVASGASSSLARASLAGVGGAGESAPYPGASGGAGAYGKRQLEGLWTEAGGPRSMATLMAAIALAESRGNPQASNQSGAEGLWQIKGQLVPGNIFNPLVNAKNAVAKYRTQGLGAWATYTSGAYRPFMARGGLVEAAKGYYRPAVHTVKAPVRKVTKPPSSKVRPHATHSPKVNLKSLRTKLGAVPGLENIAGTKRPEEVLNSLSAEQSLLSAMSSNPEGTFVLPSDMQYLSPTLAEGENIQPWMTVRAGEQQHQVAVGKDGESEELTLQQSLLQWMGGLDNHRLITPSEAGILGQFGGGHPGVKVSAYQSLYSSEGAVYGREIFWQETMVKVQQAVIAQAKRARRGRELREAKIKKVMEAKYKRYTNIKAHIRALTTGTLKNRLKEAQSTNAKNTLIADATAEGLALKEATAQETANPEGVSSSGSAYLTAGQKSQIGRWTQEGDHLTGYIDALRKPLSKVDAAEVALIKNDLTDELVPIGEDLKVLGGSSSSVGKAGRYGEMVKEVNAINSGLPTLETDVTTAAQSTIPGLKIALEGVTQGLALAAAEIAPTLAAGAGAENTQLVSLLKEELTQTQEKLSIQTAQRQVFANFAATIPHFDQGGPVLDDTLAMVHKGEYVVPREGTLAMGGSPAPNITVEHHTHIHGDAQAFIKAVDSRVTHPRNVQAVSRQMMQRTQLIGGRVR